MNSLYLSIDVSVMNFDYNIRDIHTRIEEHWMKHCVWTFNFHIQFVSATIICRLMHMYSSCLGQYYYVIAN